MFVWSPITQLLTHSCLIWRLWLFLCCSRPMSLVIPSGGWRMLHLADVENNHCLVHIHFLQNNFRLAQWDPNLRLSAAALGALPFEAAFIHRRQRSPGLPAPAHSTRPAGVGGALVSLKNKHCTSVRWLQGHHKTTSKDTCSPASWPCISPPAVHSSTPRPELCASWPLP